MTSKSRRTVMVFGTFDGLHPGHRSFLKQARRYGDYFIVVVAQDKTVRVQKKHAPRFPLRERINRIRNLHIADEVIAGNAPSRISTFPLIRKVQPEVICAGYDQLHYIDTLRFIMRRWKKKPRVVRLKAYRPQKYKSSLLRTRESRIRNEE